MEKVIVAFESDKSCRRIKDILEAAGTASCIVCRSSAEVKRVVNKLHITAVVCGYKFPDESAEDLFDDLPASCAMLLVAPRSLLELCENEDIFKLAAPCPRGTWRRRCGCSSRWGGGWRNSCGPAAATRSGASSARPRRC